MKQSIENIKNKVLHGCGCTSIGIVVMMIIVVIIGICVDDEEEEC